MAIFLSKDLEQIVHDAVRAGLYAREEDVIREALTRLSQSPEPVRRAVPAGAGKDAVERTLVDAMNQRLLAAGLLTRLPDPAEDIDDDDPEDQPIEISGEPLSETVIRERR